jgi:hypothetical protein
MNPFQDLLRLVSERSIVLGQDTEEKEEIREKGGMYQNKKWRPRKKG